MKRHPHLHVDILSAGKISFVCKVQPLFAPKAFNPQTKAPANTGSTLSPRRSSLRGNVVVLEAPRGASWDFSDIAIFPPKRPSTAPEPPLPASIQRKLKVGAVDDPLEHEADHIADQVMRMPAPHALTASAPPHVSRKCAGCEQEAEERDKLQKKETGLGVAASDAPANVYETLRSPGQPLDSNSRAFFEPRFAQDFSGVRIHTGTQAAESARAVNALAYTLGPHIVFGDGQFSPDTQNGRRLIAHELAHVVQQDRGQVGPSLQRRLILQGDAKDADLALRLLEPGSGLTLERDKKTGEVSVKAQSARPHSPALEKELLTVINDAKQDAEIHVMQKKDPPGSNIEFGEFPLDAPDYDAGVGVALVQQVRIDEVAALEKGVSGAGAYTLSHEIWENFSAHSSAEAATDKKLKGQKRGEMHDRVHPVAEKQANLVAGELIGPGERKAMFAVPIEVGKPPKQILRHVEDMKQYFLVWDQDFGSSAMLNVHKADRIQVSKYTLQGPDDNIVAKIVADLKENPTATAHFEGFAGGQKSPGENQQAALKNVFLIEEIVFQTAKASDIVSHSRFFEDGSSTTNQDSVVVTIERPSK